MNSEKLQNLLFYAIDKKDIYQRELDRLSGKDKTYSAKGRNVYVQDMDNGMEM